jgi:hypothetical protein
MGFLRVAPEIERWLSTAAARFWLLSDGDYTTAVADWRVGFEDLLLGACYLEGGVARRETEAALPFDALVFSMPGYRLLPGSTGERVPSYGYGVEHLRRVDFEAANAAEAVIVDRNFGFTCLCTHEEGGYGAMRFLRG